MDYFAYYRLMLKREFEFRRMNNNRYSLRAFARDIGVSSSRLSMIFRGEQGLSYSRAKQVCERFSWDESDKQFFCDLVEAGSGRSQAARKKAEARVSEFISQSRPHRYLTRPEFQALSDWYYFAFLQLTRTHDFHPDFEWISQRLQISVESVEEMVNFLITNRYIHPGTYKELNGGLSAPDESPSLAIRKFTKQVIMKSIDAIDNQSTDQRFISTITISIPNHLRPDIFQMIQKFNVSLNNFISENSCDQPLDEVYCYSNQFFAMSHRGENNE